MSTRTTRRAAARRPAIVDSDDEIADATMKPAEDSEDDFAPAPARTPRKSTSGRRKTTTDLQATPKKPGRPKKSLAPSNEENFDPDETAATVIDSEATAKKASPRKRKSIAPNAAKSVSEDLPVIPTPKPSASPEPTVPGTPLSDITSTSLNEQSRPNDDTLTAIKPIKAMDTIMEKPMDIVLKSRTMAVPVIEDTGPKARLCITYLILTNFKSYAGRQEVGPFHASFSSVVGPNGSGKSNVIDSLLFVFGFRASKMRQGKLSALIHNSAQYPDLDHCEVAVHFREVMDLVSYAPVP
jgi:structural maintenance of chromosome 4